MADIRTRLRIHPSFTATSVLPPGLLSDQFDVTRDDADIELVGPISVADLAALHDRNPERFLIVVLPGPVGPADTAELLDAGADAVTGGPSPAELLARLRSLLRRASPGAR